MAENIDGYPILRNSLIITYGVKQMVVDTDEFYKIYTKSWPN